jgi:hypothetical protein
MIAQRSLAGAASVATVLALLVTGPALWAGLVGTSLGAVQYSEQDAALAKLRVSLSSGAYEGFHLSSPFYAVNYIASGSQAKFAAAGTYYNATPLTVYRIGGGGEGYDPTTSTLYSPPATGGKFIPSSATIVNFTLFKAWCYSHTPHCEWMTYLPAEENNTTAAVHWATYFHQVLKFVPTFWMFGNEPVAWTHYGKNQSLWSTRDALTPTPLDYATMVKNYIAGVAKSFPSDRFIGIESGCSCDWQMIGETVALNGGKVAAVAYHEFPSLNQNTSTPAQVFGALLSSTNISNAVAQVRTTVTGSCSTCTKLPIEIGAYQVGPSGSLSPLAMQYPGAVFAAASVIQAIAANASMFTLFSSTYLYNSSSQALLPQGVLYSALLSNMTMGSDYSVKLSTNAPNGVFALLVKNGTRESLLLVNANATASFALSVPTTLFPVGTTGSYWQWGLLSSTPTPHRSVTLPSSYFIPAEGILLLDNY